MSDYDIESPDYHEWEFDEYDPSCEYIVSKNGHLHKVFSDFNGFMRVSRKQTKKPDHWDNPDDKGSPIDKDSPDDKDKDSPADKDSPDKDSPDKDSPDKDTPAASVRRE